MGLIAPKTAISDRPHRVTLSVTGTPVPDGDGGYTVPTIPLNPPTWTCSVRPVSAADLERLTAGTAVTLASYVLTGPFHSGITTATRVQFKGRLFYVNGVVNPDERNIETMAFCEEQAQGPAAFQPGAFQASPAFQR